MSRFTWYIYHIHFICFFILHSKNLMTDPLTPDDHIYILFSALRNAEKERKSMKLISLQEKKYWIININSTATFLTSSRVNVCSSRTDTTMGERDRWPCLRLRSWNFLPCHRFILPVDISRIGVDILTGCTRRLFFTRAIRFSRT